MDHQQFSQPKPVKSSKPPVKSWSELLTTTNSNTVKPPPQNSKSPIASGNNSGCPSRPTSAISLEIDLDSLNISDDLFVPDSELLSRPLSALSLQSRPIVNPGNRCYMIAVLQVLLHTRPLTNYLLKYFFKLDGVTTILSSGRFPLLESLKSFYSHFTTPNPKNSVPHEPIDEIFLTLKGKSGSFSSAGFAEQEDAEEFLTAFLDALADEFINLHAQKLLNFSLPFTATEKVVVKRANVSTVDINNNSNNNSDDDDDEWLQVGPKQRVATTRRTPVSQSPIHTLFSGNFQSLYTAPKTRPSITFEPFTILPLSLVKERDLTVVDSISGAIDHVLRCEDLGKKCSKQLSFASLPPILIIQLKRFIYKQHTSHNHLELHKITKPIKIPLELTLNQGNSNSFTYTLYALVNHHGSSLNTGHYTSIIRRSDEWSCFDDDVKIQPVGNIESVLNQNSSAYLLFYERNNNNNK